MLRVAPKKLFHLKCEIKFENNARLQVGGLHWYTDHTSQILRLLNAVIRSGKNTRPKLKSQIIGLLDFTGVVEKSCCFSF